MYHTQCCIPIFFFFQKSFSHSCPQSSLGSQVYDDNGHIWWQYDGMLGLFWCEDSKKTDSDSYSCPGGDPAMKIMAEEHPDGHKKGEGVGEVILQVN